AADLLAEKGYDPVYGARPLKRVIQKEIADPLAMAMLEGRYEDGSTVKVDAEGSTLVLACPRPVATLRRSRSGGELFRQSHEDSLGAADVTEAIDVFVLHYIADEHRAPLPEPFEGLV